jgi:hypothetical protein
MNRKNALPLVLSILGTMYGCEYELDKENFKDIEAPSETHLFELNLIPHDDTIKVFNDAEFSYYYDTHGLAVKQAKFVLSDKSWDINSDNGTFTISPEELPAGYDTLTMFIYTGSGTGSIADAVGYEGYLLEKKWLLLIDGRSAPPITPEKSITEDGFLKVSWAKNEQYNFHSYEVEHWTGNGFIRSTIADPDSTCIIDSSYVGGDAYYRVNTRVITGNWVNLGTSLQLNDPIPTLNFEDMGVDSLKIFWNKSKYKCSYQLLRTDTYPATVVLGSSVDTSFVIAHPGFGQRSQFSLVTSPYHLNETNSNHSRSDLQYHEWGTHIASNWPNYGYNHLDQAIYTNTYDDMECYDVSSMDLLKSVRLQDLIYEGAYSCAGNSTKVATTSADNIYVFSNKDLNDPVIIPYGKWGGAGIDHFFLTDNDLIAVAKSNNYDLISLTEKKVVANFTIDDYPLYSKWGCFATSNDGRYACIVTYNGVNIYEMENGTAVNTYSDNRSYRSVAFDTNNPEQLLLTFNDNTNLEIRNVSDFSLVRTISLPSPAQVLRNIDPANGYLLSTDYDYLYILDLSSSNVVLKVKCNQEYKAHLYNNRLFGVYGYTLDISKYIK